jgi:hypothetical protein
MYSNISLEPSVLGIFLTDMEAGSTTNDRWAQYRGRQPKGFIKDFSRLLKEKLPDANLDFIELNTLVNLSAVCGNISHMNRWGVFKSNIFALVIGPSGLGFKTKIMIENGSELIEQVSDELTFPGRFSIEGAIEWFVGDQSEDKDENDKESSKNKSKPRTMAHPDNILYRDEFTSLVKDKDKPYLSDLPEFLSELYTGTVQKRYTKTAKLEKTDKVYFSMISVTTRAIYPILPKDYFSQGLGNRFIYAVITPDDLTQTAIDYDAFFGKDSIGRDNDNVNELLTILRNLRQSCLRNIEMDREAGTLWLGYKNEKGLQSIAAMKIDELGPVGGYLDRVPGNAMKLSMLHRISRFASYELTSEYNPETITIELEDMEWAIGKMEKSIDHFHALIAGWVKDTQKEPEAEKKIINFMSISKMISECPDKWMTRNELLSIPGLFIGTKKEFFELINDMIESKYLVEFRIKEMAEDVLIRHQIEPTTTNKGKGLRLSKTNPYVISQAINTNAMASDNVSTELFT